MKRYIKSAYYDDDNVYDGRDGQPNEDVTTALTRTITLSIKDVEAEVDENDIEYSSYDWASYNGDGEHEVDWPSDEDDPQIEDLDYTSSIADKVTELLLDKVFEHVDQYRTFKINSCKVTLVYMIPDASYEVSSYGAPTGGKVDYNRKDVYWSEADSTIECDWSRL